MLPLPNMIRPGIFFALLLLAGTADAQQPGNPFDLAYRKPAPRANTTIPTTSLDSARTSDTVEADPLDSAAVKLRSPLRLDSTSTDTPVNNPFEKNAHGHPVQAEAAVRDTPLATGGNGVGIRHLLHPARGVQISFLLLSLLLLIFIVNVEQGFVRDLWRVVANENYSALQQRNQRNTMRRILTAMGYLVFVLQGGLFLFHVIRILHADSPWIRSLWSATALVGSVYVVRHLFIGFFRWLFNWERQMTLFAFEVTVFNTMVGLVLLPANVLLLFGPESLDKSLVFAGLAIAAGAYGLRQLRWLAAARTWVSASLLLFFLYLCAVEILPLWALSAILW